MSDAKLIRTSTGDQGTFGVLMFSDFHLATGELPWRNNKSNYSCIPVGEYTVRLRSSPKYGNVYHVTDVAGRSYILFHQGNFCGDRTLGFRTNVQGCILLGFNRGLLYRQQAVLASRLARTRFETVMGFETFTLQVKQLWIG